MDAASITAIASATIKILAPYLTEAAKGAGAIVGGTVMTGVMAKAKETYEAVKGHLVESESASEALSDLEKSPTDADAQAALRIQLKKFLSSNPGFAETLARFIREADSAGADSAFNTNISGDVEKLVNIGSVNGDVSF